MESIAIAFCGFIIFSSIYIRIKYFEWIKFRKLFPYAIYAYLSLFFGLLIFAISDVVVFVDATYEKITAFKHVARNIVVGISVLFGFLVIVSLDHKPDNFLWIEFSARENAIGYAIYFCWIAAIPFAALFFGIGWLGELVFTNIVGKLLYFLWAYYY